MSRSLTVIVVRRAAGARNWGRLIAGGRVLPCAIGRSGMTALKREGDGATPIGRFRLLGLWLRPDRKAVRSRLPIHRIRRDDGWCDDPCHRLYNRPIRLPFPASREIMWRQDGLYDLVVDIAWNRGPIVRGRGSAIFMHVARTGFQGTEGCVALRQSDLRWLVERLSRRSKIVLG